MSERFCKYHPTQKATRIVGHGHGAVCEDCWALICVGKNPAPTRQPGESEKVEAEIEMGEKCHCGRDKGHTGRHIGFKVAGGSTTPKLKVSSNGHASGRFADVIAQLEADREKLDEAIAVLKKLDAAT